VRIAPFRAALILPATGRVYPGLPRIIAVFGGAVFTTCTIVA
jgi:hypothetical protein